MIADEDRWRRWSRWQKHEGQEGGVTPPKEGGKKLWIFNIFYSRGKSE